MARKLLLTLLVLLALIAGYFLITRLFPSEKRRLEWTLADVHKAVEGGDALRCLAFVSPDYSYDMMDRKALEQFAHSVLTISGPMKLKTLKQETTVLPDGRMGVVAGEVVSLPCPGSKLPMPVKTSWNLMFRKEGKDWKIWQIELNAVNDQPANGLRGLMKLATEGM